MAQILIRNVDVRTVARLKAQAKRHGRSLQGEVKEILSEASRCSGLEEQKWRALFDYGRRKAQAAGIRTEEDVERLIDLARKPSRHPRLAV